MDIVVIMVDAWRADALDITDATGARLRVARRLDDWIRFDRYCAAAPWTLPACTSLFTGTDSQTHRHYSHEHVLGHASLLELLADHHRVAVINNSVLTRTSGLDAGFDEFRYTPDVEAAFDLALEVLQAPGAEPAPPGAGAGVPPRFVFFHTNVVHDYYQPASRAYVERYQPERGNYFDIRYRVLAWRDLTPEQVPGMRATYDACVLRLDERLDEILAAIPDDAAVLLLADHGEGFEPERARIHHGGRLHDDLLRVPCALRLPSTCPEATRRALLDAAGSGAVGTADLFPTLLALAGVTIPEEHGDLDGVDLAAAGVGRALVRAEDHRYLYLANRLRLNTNTQGKNTTRRARLKNRWWRSTVARRHALRAVVVHPFKLVVTELETTPGLIRLARGVLRRLHNGDPLVATRGRVWYGIEVFDRATDPGETRNLVRDRPDLAAALLDVDARATGDVDRDSVAARLLAVLNRDAVAAR